MSGILMTCQIGWTSKDLSINGNGKNYYSYEERWIKFQLSILSKNTLKKIKRSITTGRRFSWYKIEKPLSTYTKIHFTN